MQVLRTCRENEGTSTIVIPLNGTVKCSTIVLQCRHGMCPTCAAVPETPDKSFPSSKNASIYLYMIKLSWASREDLGLCYPAGRLACFSSCPAYGRSCRSEPHDVWASWSRRFDHRRSGWSVQHSRCPSRYSPRCGTTSGIRKMHPVVNNVFLDVFMAQLKNMTPFSLVPMVWSI